MLISFTHDVIAALLDNNSYNIGKHVYIIFLSKQDHGAAAECS